MKLKIEFFCIFFLIIFFAGPLSSQPFSKKFIMSFHTCDSACVGFQDHKVNLAESDDGASWTLVPNFVPYNGSVPDVIVRGNKLYIYTPNKVKRYDNATNQWDPLPVNVSVVDQSGNPVSFVDPSPLVDSNGKIVLFFLNSTGSTGDPASCTSLPCTKYFDSAVEVDASDGTQFTLQSGNRASVTLTTTGQTASDPDIYFDGSKYILYISRGQSTDAYFSTLLHGSYTVFPNLSAGQLTNMGSVPCGQYDVVTGKYWTYIHANASGNIIIRQAIHSDFNSQLTTFTTVISGPIISQPTSTKTESPGICSNDFLSSLNEIKTDKRIVVYPNPSSNNIEFSLPDFQSYSLLHIKIIDILGNILIEKDFFGSKTVLTHEFAQGLYFFEISSEKKVLANGKLIVK